MPAGGASSCRASTFRDVSTFENISALGDVSTFGDTEDVIPSMVVGIEEVSRGLTASSSATWTTIRSQHPGHRMASSPPGPQAVKAK